MIHTHQLSCPQRIYQQPSSTRGVRQLYLVNIISTGAFSTASKFASILSSSHYQLSLSIFNVFSTSPSFIQIVSFIFALFKFSSVLTSSSLLSYISSCARSLHVHAFLSSFRLYAFFSHVHSARVHVLSSCRLYNVFPHVQSVSCPVYLFSLFICFHLDVHPHSHPLSPLERKATRRRWRPQ